MESKEYAEIQKAFRDALVEAMKPYKNRPLTPQRREQIKKEAIDITRRMIPAKMDVEHLERFIDGILDQGLNVDIK
jgi:hypothetical protein